MTNHTLEHSHETMDATQQHSVLNDIYEGMPVYDQDQQKIGEVEAIHFGASSNEQRAYGVGSSSVSEGEIPETNPITDVLASVFDPSEMPEELGNKLWQSGFVRIAGTGLFASDLYITPNQIDKVTDESVYLTVDRDELISRT